MVFRKFLRYRWLRRNKRSEKQKKQPEKHKFFCKSTRNCVYQAYLKIIEGERPEHLEVRCANCNIIHEYERGNYKMPQFDLES